MITLRSVTMLAALILMPVSGAVAQTPAIDSGAAPALQLSPAQKQTIYQSITATQKNNPAPTGFRAAVGAEVPETISLAPIPKTLANLIPTTAEYEVAMVEKQVVLVDPRSRRVVAVVAQ
jgi:hypothetical protein